jgi:hypothetical protein
MLANEGMVGGDQVPKLLGLDVTNTVRLISDRILSLSPARRTLCL